MTCSTRPRQRGAALLMVLVAMATAMTLVVGWLGAQDNSALLASNATRAAAARATAQSGLEIAVAILQSEAPWQTAHEDGWILQGYEFGTGTLDLRLIDEATGFPPGATTTVVRIESTAHASSMVQTATALATARNVGGVSFDGTSDVNLPGVNTAGNQNTTGNADTATLATGANTVKTVTDGTDANYFLTFVDANNGSATLEALKTDAGIQYNPSTDTLSVTNITATIDGVSSAINVADESSDTTCFPVFVTSASGNLAAKSGTNLSFNSSSGALTATSFTDENGDAMTTAANALSDATAISVALG